MNDIQKKILELSKKYDLNQLGLRQIGRLINEPHPQKIKYHIEQLTKAGLLESKPQKWNIKIGKFISLNDFKKHSIISVPIFGFADCGPAGVIAEENLAGFLKVSSKFLPKKEGLFAIEAQGVSMNKAKIGDQRKNIEPGDYVIIDNENRSPDNNDYVLSIIDGLANIKKFNFDRKNNQITLLSESTEKFSPIFIHPNDEKYMINGKVVQVIKK